MNFKQVLVKLLGLLLATVIVLPSFGAFPHAVTIAEGVSGGGGKNWNIFGMYIPREWNQDYDVIFTWQGEMPSLPTTATAVVDKSTEDDYNFEEIPIGVSWDMSGFNCNRVGSFHITAAPPQSELDRLHLTNTEGATAYMLVSVQKRGPIDSLHGKFISNKGDTKHRIRLYLPVLRQDASAVYLYTKTADTPWVKVLNPDGEENFLDPVWGPSIVFPGTEQDFRYDYTPQRLEPITVRMEIEGSENAGFTNEITLFPPGYIPPPGSSTDDDSDKDDDNSGGDRGGGGQEVGTRNIPQPTPIPLAVKPTPTPMPTPTPAPTPSAPPSSSSTVQAQEVMGGAEPTDDHEPPPRTETGSNKPMVTAAVILTAGAGAAGYIFLKKRP